MTENQEKKNEDSSCGCGGGSCCGGPGKWIWIILTVAVVGVLIAKNAGKKPALDSMPEASVVSTVVEATGARGVPEPVLRRGPFLVWLIWGPRSAYHAR